jgi:hypothetical protein
VYDRDTHTAGIDTKQLLGKATVAMKSEPQNKIRVELDGGKGAIFVSVSFRPLVEKESGQVAIDKTMFMLATGDQAKSKLGKGIGLVGKGVGKLFSKLGLRKSEPEEGSAGAAVEGGGGPKGPSGTLELTIHQARGLIAPRDAKAFFKGARARACVCVCVCVGAGPVWHVPVRVSECVYVCIPLISFPNPHPHHNPNPNDNPAPQHQPLTQRIRTEDGRSVRQG